MEQAEQLYQQLSQKPTLTGTESDWINRYLPVRSQYYSPVLESSHSAYPAPGPDVERASLPSEDVPEPVVPDPVDPVEHMGVLDRLQLEEEQRNKSLEGVL